jgi:DNA-binding CsgD family transcriptional regulator
MSETETEKKVVKKKAPEKGDPLSPREEKVFHLIGRGLSPTDICTTMKLKQNNVFNLRKIIYAKLGVVDATGCIRRHRELHPNCTSTGIQQACQEPPYGCGLSKDILHFPYWPVDKRCSECIGAERKIARQEHKLGRLRGQLEELIRVTGKRSVDVPHVTKLVDSLYDRFGGFDSFVGQFYDQLEKAIEKNPGSKTVFDQFRMVFNLNIEANKMDGESQLGKMSDDELVDYMWDLMVQRIDDMRSGADREKILKLFMDDDDIQDIAASSG